MGDRFTAMGQGQGSCSAVASVPPPASLLAALEAAFRDMNLDTVPMYRSMSAAAKELCSIKKTMGLKCLLPLA